MKKEELVIYEAPTITEFISIDWVQNLMAKYIAWTVTRKYNRYEQRLKRRELLELSHKEKK